MHRSLKLFSLSVAAVLVVAACSAGSTPSPSSGGAGGSPGASGAAGSAGGSSGSGAGAGTTITVTSLWGGSEQAACQKVLEAFKAKTGITATYQSQRTDYATVLQSKITGGNPPDVAIMPGLGFLRQFARSGGIKKISDLGIDPSTLTSLFPPGLLDPSTVDGSLYGIMVDYNSKSTVWYRPDIFSKDGVSVPKTWTDFKSMLDQLKSKGETTPLAMGAKDSWTLTDWFEEIYLRQNGPDAYKKLFSPNGDWTDPTVKTAIQTMMQVINDNYIVGGIKGSLGTAFTDAIGEIYSANPKAAVFYEGGFVGGLATGQVNSNLVAGKTYDWFPFPDFGNSAGTSAAEIGGDVIAALTTNPGVKEFIQYMTTADSGTTWAKTGSKISTLKAVPASAYPTQLQQKEAQQVQSASAVVYDGSDTLPAAAPDMGAMLQNAIQGQNLDGLLSTFNSAVKSSWANEK